MKKTFYTFILLFVSIQLLQAQSVSFPDDARTRGYYDRPYKRYEAEQYKCQTNGIILPATFDQREIQSEASNQIAVQLTNAGDSVAWTNDEAADGLTIRFSLPDNAAGTGTTGTIALYVDDVFVQNIELNSYWAWQYFTNNMSSAYADNTPAANKFARMRFDETRVKLAGKIPANATFKLVKENDESVYTIDFVELEPIPDKVEKPDGAVEYNPATDGDLADFVAAHGGQTIYVPEGRIETSKQIKINADNTKLIGAGMWYTEIYFAATPTVKGNRGISTDNSNVTVDGFYLTSFGERRYSNYTSAGNGAGKAIMGTFGNGSTVKNVWAVHFECGAWLAGGGSNITENLTIQNCRFRNNYADGTNLARGAKNCTVEHISYRNNGDDDMASWSQDNRATENITFQYNTSENCWRAAGIGFFGGKQNKALNCVVIDPVESGVRANNDFGGAAFSTDGFFEISNVSIYRAGQKSNDGKGGIAGDLWGWRCGALYINSGNSNYDVTNFKFSNIDIYESKGDAIMLRSTGSSKSIKNLSLEGININGVNISGAGNNFTYFGLYFENGKGTDNTYCIHYYNVPENLKTYQIPASGFTETFECEESPEVVATALYIFPASKTIKVGETLDLAALTTVLPVAVTDKSLTFDVVETMAANNISLDADGKVTGLSESEAAAVVKISSASNEDVYAEITITVQGYAVTGVSLPATLTLNLGETYQLTPIFTPENADNKNVTWSGGNAIASVSTTGLVTALKVSSPGVANIKVTTQDGNYTATCTVTVIAPTPVISPNEENELQIIAFGNTIQISNFSEGENISVYNLLGTKVYSVQLNDSGTRNIRGLRDGIYTVVAEKARVVKKVMITK
ncbi:MAG: Ig-like domain-containing protein [Prevotellaceae bacterium]|jgi:uncharacterized protein YjdB|nr:Ig-like domain-containing protein [Prevotellaceae bacterium]